MDQKESDRGDFAESEFPNDDLMRERVTPCMTLNNVLLAADKVFDIHCTCEVCLRNLILVCDASFVRPST